LNQYGIVVYKWWEITALILTIDADIIIPSENSRIIDNQISNSELITIPGGGHPILIEQPDL